MKKYYFMLFLGILAGCSNPNSETLENHSRDEIVDTVIGPYDAESDTGGEILFTEGELVGLAEEADAMGGEVPPYSVEELLDVEIPGSDFTVGRILLQNAAYTRYYITYISDGITISGIMNVPKATVGNPGPWPTLFLNHGYIDPVIYTNGRGLKREQDYFARNGYIVIHSDYRGHAQSDPNPVTDDKVGESGYTRDILGGINAFKSLNPDYAHVNQIGLLGHSMGGGVTMKTMVARPDHVQAAVLYAPVSSDYLDNLQRWMLDRITAEEVAKVQDENGQWDAALAAPYSVMTYFDRVTTPVMIHHGDLDADVPIQWSKDTLSLLQRAGKDVIYHEYTGEGHEFGVQWTKFMERSTKFFDQHLKS